MFLLLFVCHIESIKFIFKSMIHRQTLILLRPKQACPANLKSWKRAMCILHKQFRATFEPCTIR